MKRSNIILVISCLISTVAVVLAMLVDKVGAVVSSLITTAITLFGAIVIWVQIRKNKIRVSGELVYNMNKILVKSSGLMNLRDKLLESDNEKDYSLDGVKNGKDETKTIENFLFDDSVNIIEYLEFFENIGEMYFAGTVALKDIDTMFGEMFFAATNNKYIQQRELVPYKEHYQTTIKLYGALSKYRKARGIVSPHESTPLDWRALVKKGVAHE